MGGAFGAGKCLYNGIGMDCEDVLMMARNGSAVPDPSQPPASGLVGGMRVTWVDAWEPCSEGDACARDVGYFATEQGGSPLATRLTPQKPGGGGGGGDRLNTGPKAKFDITKFQTCLNDMFGITLGLSDGRTQALWFDRNKGGHFDGYMRGNTWFTVNTDLRSFNSKQLGKMYENEGGEPGEQTGLTLGATPKVNYIANNVAAWSKHTTIGLFGLFIHELGNALGANRFGINAYSDYAEQNKGNSIKDPDAGAAFETCVFGGLVGLRSGRVGNDREFLPDAP